jgi:FMN phosphatase YigB (HAD superfamily)
MLTLAHYPPDSELVAAAGRSIGRLIDEAGCGRIVARLHRAREHVSVRERLCWEDTSIELHRSVTMDVFDLAGLDAELAAAAYALLGKTETHPIYPDVAVTLRSIRELGIRIAVISDIHVDLRRHAEHFGCADAIDCWVLSFELGVQKPDALMFTTALDALGVEATEALMVGDRASHDGGAANVGIDTLILPTDGRFGPRGLDRVVRLVS